MASPRWIHDVFLCFHGHDTRYNFVSHLHRALQNASLDTCIDSNMPRGENLSSSLFQAIENSRTAIIVISPNFASSRWCLDEVVKIVECKRFSGQLVLPVFFHVAPSDIREHVRVLQPILAMLEEDFRNDLQKVERWRSALREVICIRGWHIHSSV